VPKIIESNSDLFADKQVDLYYVADFIEGIDLQEFTTSQKMSESDISKFLVQLISLVELCHKDEFVHRDIKPLNIMLRGEEILLVDFGIAHSNDGLFETKVGEELGNRFLRLPELSSGSSQKVDFRSDITFIVGIAFFLLTKEYPRILIDEKNQMPHQRDGIQDKVNKFINKDIWNQMFDIGFRNEIENRWQSLESLRSIIPNISDKNKSDIEKAKSVLTLHANSLSVEQLKRKQIGLQTLRNNYIKVIKKFISEVAPSFGRYIQTSVVSLGDDIAKSQIRCPLITDGDSPDFVGFVVESKVVGSHIIVCLFIGEKANMHNYTDFERLEIFRMTIGEVLPEGVSSNKFLPLPEDTREKITLNLSNFIMLGNGE
jgi:serine/threonine-protein kinase